MADWKVPEVGKTPGAKASVGNKEVGLGDLLTEMRRIKTLLAELTVGQRQLLYGQGEMQVLMQSLQPSLPSRLSPSGDVEKVAAPPVKTQPSVQHVAIRDALQIVPPARVGRSLLGHQMQTVESPVENAGNRSNTKSPGDMDSQNDTIGCPVQDHEFYLCDSWFQHLLDPKPRCDMVDLDNCASLHLASLFDDDHLGYHAASLEQPNCIQMSSVSVPDIVAMPVDHLDMTDAMRNTGLSVLDVLRGLYFMSSTSAAIKDKVPAFKSLSFQELTALDLLRGLYFKSLDIVVASVWSR
jgi:hypothetical protein